MGSLGRILLTMAQVVLVVACGGSGTRNGGGSSHDGDAVASLDLHDPAVMQGHIVRLIEMAGSGDSITTAKEVTGFFDGIKHDEEVIALADSLVAAYLNDPNSPVRDEAKYIFFLENMLKSDTLPEAVRERGRERLRIARINRPGMVAADFDYIDIFGKRHSLHDEINGTTLLVFYDPECGHCSEILNELAGSRMVNEAIGNGELKVLAIYAEGKRSVWDKSKRSMPGNWQTGYDVTGILDKDLYDLPAMPTLYLLDADCRVIAKDLSPSAFRSNQ